MEASIQFRETQAFKYPTMHKLIL